MELWDAYFRDGTPAGVELRRGEPVPQGLYHLVCEVLVRHVDGSYLLMERDSAKPNYPGWLEATAGGAALKGEDKLACVRRELLEETGIRADSFEETGLDIRDGDGCLFYSFLTVTGWPKDKVVLQPGETWAYRWLSEAEFAAFVRSGWMIPEQKARWADYFARQGWL